MAGGITDLANFAGGTSLGGAGGLSSTAGMAGLASANPYMAAFQVASALFGGAKADISSAGASGQALSGFGKFANDDVIRGGSRLIDFSDIKSVAGAAVVLVAVIYAIKKFKR